ncbi:DUF805 domain-containing protein [Asticcacaulis tiandongensis]|uniref:DUF805 domain-containing protein n=1 Tax=Asticcacaulis tiandongensis TaxID=2565365 RepID=UPI0015E83480|nr:DUF805 domain-containing protein [Asticcacaulis tiandongensis]
MTDLSLAIQPLKKYFDFKGRARRTEYWLFFALQVAISVVFNLFQAAGGATAGIATGLGMLVSLGLLIPSLAVGVRRFHDTGRTGWWIIFYPVVYIISVFAFAFTHPHLAEGLAGLDPSTLESGDPEALTAFFNILGPQAILWVVLPTWIASLVTFVFHVQDGQPQPNKFGDDPKGRGVTSNEYIF